jgi:hypothetical protein
MAKFSDEFHQQFGDAVADIRAKYEEAVYGRTVTERGEAPAWPQAQEQEQQPSFGGVTRTIDMGPTHDQIGGNANYRLAQMERECNGGEWPKADQSHEQRERDDKNRDQDIDR